MYPAGLTSRKRSGDFAYRPIRIAPSLTTPVTYIPGDIHVPSSSYLYSSHGGVHNVGRDIIWAGNFASGVTLNDFTATGVADYRMVNAAGAVFGAAVLADHAVDAVTDSDRQKFYGLSELEPWLCRSQTQNGFQLASRVGGANFLLQNVVVDTPGASGVTANFGTSSSRFYNSLIIDGLRVIGYVVNCQEGLYIGHTSPGFDYLQDVFITDFFTTGRGREGLQLGHINNLKVSGFTLFDVGKGGTAAQMNLVQLHDLLGTIENGICDTAPNPWNIFTHGTTIRNVAFRYTGARGFIGDIATQSYFGLTARSNGLPLIFEDCFFWKDSVGTDTLTEWVETGCNLEFRRCGFSSNIANGIVLDTRPGTPKNVKIGTTSSNGNFTYAFTAPSYQSLLATDYTTHGLVNPGLYRDRGMGFRTR